MKKRETIAYVIDPRLPGGTSSAVAQELRVMAPHYQLVIYAIKSQMFKGDIVAPQIASILEELQLELIWDPTDIAADTVILQNPAFLKFQTVFEPRIVTHDLIVVTHENFLRPSGAEAFDVGKCLELLDRNTLAFRKQLAPISAYNRRTVTEWTALNSAGVWTTTPENWFNICEFDLTEPSATPQDRRGRLSRAGYEKFPTLDDMDLCFPATAEANVILGADTFLADDVERPHWSLLPFRQITVDQFMERIDYMIYFTAPTWRESFGRVLAEATAAGKLVITDPLTAENFGDGLVAATPQEVNALVAGFIADPARYQEQVRRAQAALSRLSSQAFLSMVTATLKAPLEIAS